jgi:hypothetical protein
VKIPAQLAAGDSVSWTDAQFTDNNGNTVNALAYGLTYSFRGPIAAANVDVVGTASGTGWLVALTTAASAAMNNGASTLTWFWQAYATKSGSRILAGEGRLLVKPNLMGASTGATFDGSTDAEQILAAITAEIKARLSGGATIEYSIGTRSLKKEPMTELIKLKEKYGAIVSREQRAARLANGLGNPTRVGVRFN